MINQIFYILLPCEFGTNPIFEHEFRHTVYLVYSIQYTHEKQWWSLIEWQLVEQVRVSVIIFKTQKCGFGAVHFWGDSGTDILFPRAGCPKMSEWNFNMCPYNVQYMNILLKRVQSYLNICQHLDKMFKKIKNVPMYIEPELGRSDGSGQINPAPALKPCSWFYWNKEENV